MESPAKISISTSILASKINTVYIGSLIRLRRRPEAQYQLSSNKKNSGQKSKDSRLHSHLLSCDDHLLRKAALVYQKRFCNDR